MPATPKAAYLWFVLLIDHSIVLYVRLNTSCQSFKETLTKAILFLPKQLQCRAAQVEKSCRSESVERCYYAKRMIMMILMIMVMNVHNLFPLSVKTILTQTGEKMGG